ncbi:MAG: outer membrane protein assembly factor BamD [Bdellovibrio sp.]
MSKLLRTSSLKSSLIFGLFLHFAAWGLVSCSTDDVKSDSAEQAFKLAQEYDKEERYEESLRRYNEVKNKFPYSKFATMAKLAIADVYFKQEAYAEAGVAYQNFKEMHPKHAQVDYVTYRLAMAYYEQLPGTIDRDLTLASSAIMAFDEVINQYPNSSYLQEAKDKKTEALKKLAAKEEYIADFYFKKELYESALARYEGLYRTYPNLGFDAKALSRAAISAQRSGDLERAKKLLAVLKQKFPGSSELSDASDEVTKK